MSEDSEKEGQPEIFANGLVINNYRIDKHIGHGGYGEIYAVTDISTNKHYAMKYETKSGENKGLVMEKEISKQLSGSKNFAIQYGEGTYKGNKYMVMELLGTSLSNTRRQLEGRHYSPYSALYLSYYTICCIEDFHSRGYIHRDIKPGNFLLRPDWDFPVCLVDFGLAISYIDRQTKEHIPNRNSVGFTGTCKYASMNAHEGHELSRRDDLISWFYSVVEFYAGRLPWPASRDKDATYDKKQRTPPETLLRKLPSFFGEIYQHIFSLDFFAKPDYQRIKELMLSELNSQKGTLDWELIDPEIQVKISEVPLVSRAPRPYKIQMFCNSPMPDADNEDPMYSPPGEPTCCVIA
ncbi:CK1 family protein kinase [Trichomonas vaginalis G3]|uniref:non-specific serine/threonine protein kinase n=1 Tax=Trichomonas vaginalis (strain ATCC PRA-98 / G3) TaxID=412133 RepID=A2ENQ0_TRIV3|nr:protein kinase protein [Trichomonas vaginalis G3]EAY05750.1 CK1 family protein kinase [Trichomonas vaginalis G3]KAI5535137.1 protein kinase protein [Trichomonas vaginalis G3]|eukprot:XP_001317973.1 CK1 family protein kinase [Trichomonas vaginalis G3]